MSNIDKATEKLIDAGFDPEHAHQFASELANLLAPEPHVVTSDDWEDVRSRVFQALGTASVCWENMEGTGVFNDVLAKQTGDSLVAYLRERFATVLTPARPTVTREQVLATVTKAFHESWDDGTEHEKAPEVITDAILALVNGVSDD